VNFPEKSRAVDVHTVPDIPVALGVPPDANTVVGVSTVAGLPSEVDICDVSIFVSAGVHPMPMF
jgi:hypothetical protein